MGFRPLSCLGSSSNSNINEENTSVKQMTYLELDKATQSFHESNMLGYGSSGRVYKGILENKEVVAVKEHNGLVRTQFSRSDQFDTEMKFLSRLQHPNIVKLLGYCKTEPEALLVYEFMPRRSLKENLSGLKPPSVVLDWNTRMRIAVGVAEGLSFLHSTESVIHGDLKESVILLDEYYNPKISGFGVARSADTSIDDQRKSSGRGFERLKRSFDTRFQSSKGVTKKTDVREFGAILFQLLSGHERLFKVNGGYKNICSWAHDILVDEESHWKLVDPLLKRNFPWQGLVAVGRLARFCTDSDSTICPSMESVQSQLKALVEKHPYSSESHYHEEESSSRPRPPIEGYQSAEQSSTVEEDIVIVLAKEDMSLAEEEMNAAKLTIEAMNKTIAAAEESIAAARKTEKAAMCKAEAALARIEAAERSKKIKGKRAL